ncbi:Phosphomannomutase [Heterostelium album PN500]|uniref:Phosphomannomutase n=1 Tax=Heterostelium pallidum (strain ATCC 26659 / Pp 5 / PN500) TaxID=670386 RepID=D3AVZ8_HETP5|nr:Phosphomannomutase [Heterostelium album PN500]EFA86471.1 Phosphomannomutase [Heterostelium album PN500]|eukprot:XP_020438576.1 Phosphomannomutase [Heterostelium album PN500]
MSLIRTISGVRGVIGDTLSPEVIVAHIAAFTMMLEGPLYHQKQHKIVVGRDSRVSGPWVERLVVGTLSACGYHVYQIGIATTPTVQFMTTELKCSGGIVITSSHNPVEWNGLKFIGSDGLFISPEACESLFKLADEKIPMSRYVTYDKVGAIEVVDHANRKHLDAIYALPFIDVEKIRSQHFRCCLDTVNGAGGPIMRELCHRLDIEIVDGLNMEPTGLFAHTPEPIPANLSQLCESVRKHNVDFGIAVDPDVDRCVFIDEHGKPLGEEYTLAMAVEFMLGDVGRRGVVAKNLSSSRALDDIAKKYESRVVCAPVGEIQVAQCMLRENAVIGGEGNGGVMLPDIHIGRDAPVAAALAFQLMANRGIRKISEVKKTLPQYEIVKLKAGIEGLNPDAILNDYKAEYRGKQGVLINEDDGLKIDAPEWWVHLRKSNTEHIIRVIAEAKDLELATSIAAKFIQEIESKRK